MDFLLNSLLLLGQLWMIIAAPVTSEDEIISQFINNYNEISAEKNRYTFYKAIDQNWADAEGESGGLKGFRFSIKETNCLKSSPVSPADCAISPDGMEKNCVLIIEEEGQPWKGCCLPKSLQKNNKKRSKEVLSDNNEIKSDLPLDIRKSHKEECLECIFTLIPKRH